MDISSLSRRSFIGRLAAVPALAVPATLAGASVVEAAVIPDASTRLDRLTAMLAHLRQLVTTEFPEFEIWGSILPNEPTKNGSLHMAFIATYQPPPPPPILEFSGPGLYEVNISQWSKTDVRVQRLERTPKHHRFAGQFRFRSPNAAQGARWQYRPESEFRLIRPAKLTGDSEA